MLADKHGLVRHDVMNQLVATGSDAALGLKFDPVKTIAKVVARLMEIINVVDAQSQAVSLQSSKQASIRNNQQ